VHDGMPIGLQIMGPAFEEEKVLKAAFIIEQMNLMKGQKPFRKSN
jgi:aspartyl-tRNA(Asn)/glutamyl-tRNA(Gln) amidotransferase subunit A